jgi:hypothetical protein
LVLLAIPVINRKTLPPGCGLGELRLIHSMQTFGFSIIREIMVCGNHLLMIIGSGKAEGRGSTC